ncbi:HNH endonuclease [Metarhizobium album]|uniref:HNH endonuclease n=1 Tax=Metarhizobium album TaxID=2182425 RepID=A0A2U2DU26_9HYPH|nr:HNH endonuclease [Rhizobium album]PWE56806.1 HNH endonuclease [Rhizobium album]
MARTVPEWIGKTDDQKVPDRVRQRVFDAHNGICHLTGRKIQPCDVWELEHIHALILGGQHRESNLAPALKEAHKKKTAVEMGVKAKIARVRKKHLGIKPASAGGFQQRFRRKMNGDVVDTRTGVVINNYQRDEAIDP